MPSDQPSVEPITKTIEASPENPVDAIRATGQRDFGPSAKARVIANLRALDPSITDAEAEVFINQRDDLKKQLVADEIALYLLVPFKAPPSGNYDVTRWGDGSHPVLYGAKAEETALKEHLHHRAKAFPAVSLINGIQIEVVVFSFSVITRLADLTAFVATHPQLVHHNNYDTCHKFTARARKAKFRGIAAKSVRHAAGCCYAIFSDDGARHGASLRLLTFQYDSNAGKFVQAAPVP